MGNRHIKIKIENDREKYPNREPIEKHRPYTMFLSRGLWHWNGTEYLSLKDMEIIRDYLTEYINNEKSKRRNKK